MNVEVIVPTLNAGKTLRRCLESLRSQSTRVQVTVVDGGSSDDTLLIASGLTDRLVKSEIKGFSHQRNLGALGSKSDVLGFVDADMVLADTVVQDVLELISNGAAGVVIPEESFGSTYWARVRAFERSFYEGENSPEAARFFVRETFIQAGGYDERLAAMEDFALDRAVRKLGSVARTDSKIQHDEGELKFLNACRKKARYAAGMATYSRIYGRRQFAGFLFGRNYLRFPFQLARKPVLGVGVVALKFGESGAVIIQLFREAKKRFLS
jgi:glycosyltransferase involved in cell wall biosynthesis